MIAVSPFSTGGHISHGGTADQKKKLLSALRAMFRGTVKARWLDEDGIYRRRPPLEGEPPFRVQSYLQHEARRLASLARDQAGVSFRPKQPEDHPSV
jgi:hypothetical protein